MNRKRTMFETFSLTLLLAVSLLATMTLTTFTVYAESSSSAKPLYFYFHYAATPQFIGGYAYANQIMNTTQFWGETQRVGPQLGTFDIYFYIAPDLVGNYRINGTFWVHLWANATGATPSAVFTITVYELSPSGFYTVGSWTSGSENLSPDIYDVNAIPGNTPLKFTVPSYTFKLGSSVVLKISVKPGAATAVSVWYDSSQYPSQVIIYSEDYLRVSSVLTFDANSTRRDQFSVFWNDTQRKVVVRANITDPFGEYDINMINVTINNPANETVLSGSMSKVSSTGDILTYESTWSYPASAMAGSYNVTVTGVDNNGYYYYMNYGTYGPYIEYGAHSFSIGIEYPVQIRTIDWRNQTMANANVRAVSDGVVLRSSYTNASGWLETILWAGYYNLTVYWHGVEVVRELIEITGASSLQIRCKVYYPSFKVVDDVDSALPEAEVYIESPNGTISIPPFYTSANGFVNLTQAPGGDYTFTILWKGVTVQDKTLTVGSDGPYAIKCRVYQLTVKVMGNNGAPVQAAYVIIYTQAGVGYGLEITDASGEAMFKLPGGTYKIDVRYSSVYWLTIVAANATKPSYSVTSSGPLTLTLTNFPPPIWATTGFWLIIIFIAIIALGTIYLLYKRGTMFKRRP